MAEHLQEAHDQQLHICALCTAIFYERSEYIDHLVQHTKEMGNARGELKCDQCDATFVKQYALEQHRKTHTNDKAKGWNCELCDKKYASKAFFEVHMNKHAGLRPYKCTICTKDFSSKYALALHEKTHYDRPRTFVCSECGSAFYSRHNLVQHERTHRAEREFECGDCGKKFFTQHNLNVHKVIHSTNKAFACRQCGKKFARKAEVRDHERTHTGEKPFVCDMCDLAFAQRSNLNSHKRLTHFNDKRYKCDLCGASFKRRRLLVYHTRAMHTGERPFKCELCPASFVYPEHFQKHKRIHTGIKPYACEVCHKTFTSQDNRNAHRYVHSDKKPYECVTCGSGFMRKAQLYAHMQELEHLNDTIVVNQPRISANDLLEFETESFVVDGHAEVEQNQDVEGSDDEEQAQTAFICEGEYEDGEAEMEQLITKLTESVNNQTLDDGQQDNDDEEEERDVEQDAVHLVLVTIRITDFVTNTTTRSYALVQMEHEARGHVVTLAITLLTIVILLHVELAEEVKRNDRVDVHDDRQQHHRQYQLLAVVRYRLQDRT
uniref:C2H2-type domain-containing protein n=1 Tax=Anopheles culicifacies TaxID=139723 RepID=A0A182MG07_9DIPT